MILKILRTNANLTQDQLADILGVKKSSIQKYESDSVSNLKRDTIRTICTYFNVPSYFFIFPELVKDEKELHKINIQDINLFFTLNNDGKRKAMDYIQDLTDLKKYTY
jgi:transcriptional regulator with XRE-family HTH domain